MELCLLFLWVFRPFIVVGSALYALLCWDWTGTEMLMSSVACTCPFSDTIKTTGAANIHESTRSAASCCVYFCGFFDLLLFRDEASARISLQTITVQDEADMSCRVISQRKHASYDTETRPWTESLRRHDISCCCILRVNILENALTGFPERIKRVNDAPLLQTLA